MPLMLCVDAFNAAQMMKGRPTPLSEMNSIYATQRNLLASNYSGLFFVNFQISEMYYY